MSEQGGADEALVRLTRPRTPDHIPGAGHGHRAMTSLLASGARPTAVLASSDMIAAGVLRAVAEAGLRVPQDISVIGFDDTLAEYLSPLLATVRLPARELGETAGRLAIDQLEVKGAPRAAREELDAELVLRKSTGPAPTD